VVLKCDQQRLTMGCAVPLRQALAYGCVELQVQGELASEGTSKSTPFISMLSYKVYQLLEYLSHADFQ
jgi:hypothetical protein